VHWVGLIQFMASFHHPWSDTHRQRAYDALVRQEVTALSPEGVQYSYERTVVMQAPGNVKAYSVIIPGQSFSGVCHSSWTTVERGFLAVAVAREILSNELGPPCRELPHQWKWKAGEGLLLDRAALVGLFGEDWYRVKYPALPGKPESYITEAQFAETFRLEYNSLSGRLSVWCERDRYIDGHKVSVEGAPDMLPFCSALCITLVGALCSCTGRSGADRAKRDGGDEVPARPDVPPPVHHLPPPLRSAAPLDQV
jgi:hypothetical protein